MSIGSRIKEARLAAKLTQKALAQKVGMAQASLSELETGESQGTTMVGSFAAALGVSALWLETGKGSMSPEILVLSDAHLPLGTLEIMPGFRRVRPIANDDDGHTRIKKVRLRVQAGITGFQVEPEHYEGDTMGVPNEWIAREQLSVDSLLAMVVRGESMEKSLYDGDVIVVNTRDTKPSDGEVFIVNYEGEVVVKRMMRDAGMWWLTSDNSDQRKFHRKSCNGVECIIIGKVVRKESTHI